MGHWNFLGCDATRSKTAVVEERSVGVNADDAGLILLQKPAGTVFDS
jgi:hypothetical protein